MAENGEVGDKALSQHLSHGPWSVPKTRPTAQGDESAHDTKFFIILFERAFKMMKNGVYFIVIALLVAESFRILIYAN